MLKSKNVRISKAGRYYNWVQAKNYCIDFLKFFGFLDEPARGLGLLPRFPLNNSPTLPSMGGATVLKVGEQPPTQKILKAFLSNLTKTILQDLTKSRDFIVEK